MYVYIQYVYVYCGEPPGSGSSSPWKRPGNAVLNTKHLQLSIMSSTAAAHVGRSLKPGEKTHWGDWILYVCTVHVAELTIKQTLTLTFFLL